MKNNPDYVSNGSVIIIIIMIRTGSQMENKLLENVSKKVEGPKEHTG